MLPGASIAAARRRPTAAWLLVAVLLLGLPRRHAAQEPDKPPVGARGPEAAVPSLEQMRRSIPAGTDPEQRKQMLRMMEAYRARMLQAGRPAMRRAPFGGPFMTPGAGPGALSRLGARVDEPGATLMAQLDLPRGQGLVLDEVREGTAAAKAGLKAHDILLELDGKVVPNNTAAFLHLLDKVKPDTPVNALVLRRGKNETIKGLKLPRAEDAGGFPPGGFPPPFPQGPAPFVPVPAAFAAPPVPFAGMPPMQMQPFAPFGGNGVLTTTFRGNDQFVTRHQEGSLVITLVGKVADGKAAVQDIRVHDGQESGQYPSLAKVPEAYRLKVKNLVEIAEKSNSRIDVKAP